MFIRIRTSKEYQKYFIKISRISFLTVCEHACPDGKNMLKDSDEAVQIGTKLI